MTFLYITHNMIISQWRIVAKITGIPHVIYTVHGFHFHEFGNKLENSIYYHLEKFAGRFMDVLITINKDDYKVAIENNMAPKGKWFIYKV